MHFIWLEYLSEPQHRVLGHSEESSIVSARPLLRRPISLSTGLCAASRSARQMKVDNPICVQANGDPSVTLFRDRHRINSYALPCSRSSALKNTVPHIADSTLASTSQRTAHYTQTLRKITSENNTGGQIKMPTLNSSDSAGMAPMAYLEYCLQLLLETAGLDKL